MKKETNSGNLIVINAKYPFLSTEELNKVIQENKSEEGVSFGAIKFYKNEFLNSSIDQIQLRLILKIFSLYIFQESKNLKNLPIIDSRNSTPVIIPWTFYCLLNKKRIL